MKNLFYGILVVLSIVYFLFINDLNDKSIDTLHDLKQYNGAVVLDKLERNAFFPYGVKLYRDGVDETYRVSQYIYEYHITLGDTIDIE